MQMNLHEDLPNQLAHCVSGALSAMVESLGDYYLAAAISEAPVPPPDIMARGVTWQGITCIITGVIGTGNGTTAYNGLLIVHQEASGMSFTLTLWCSHNLSVLFGPGSEECKVGGLFASIPNPILSGLFTVIFGIIVGTGISQFQDCDTNSPRNLFIFGFALYMGISVPYYFMDELETKGMGPVQTNSDTFNQIANSIFQTGAAVALIITMVLDNTVPGTFEERGLDSYFLPTSKDYKWWDHKEMYETYGLPFGMTKRYEEVVGPVREKIAAASIKVGSPFKACWRRCFRQRKEEQAAPQPNEA